MTDAERIAQREEMSREERWEFLLIAAKRVLLALRRGHNPTFEQLDKLENAVASIDSLKICGHRQIEDCECLKTMYR